MILSFLLIYLKYLYLPLFIFSTYFYLVLLFFCTFILVLSFKPVLFSGKISVYFSF